MTNPEAKNLRRRLDLWVATRVAHDALEAVMELEDRAAYGPALRQLFSAELDAAEDLARQDIDVHLRAAEDPPTALLARNCMFVLPHF
ncbi:MAG: hypothetical protein WEB06_13280 [Actinomycetota bacterium]